MIRPLLVIFFIILSPLAWSKPKVKVKYRSHTEFDFAGDQISGKAKGAGVFYIFQRKRSKEHKFDIYPSRITWHHRKIESATQRLVTNE